MGQSGRVWRGGRGCGEYRRGPGGGRGAHRSSVAPSVPAPEARARPGAAPQPRGLRRATALVRVHAGQRGSQRPAAQPGRASGHGAAHRHPSAGLPSQPASTHPGPSSRLRAGSVKPREAAVSRLENGTYLRTGSLHLAWGLVGQWGQQSVASLKDLGQGFTGLLIAHLLMKGA